MRIFYFVMIMLIATYGLSANAEQEVVSQHETIELALLNWILFDEDKDNRTNDTILNVQKQYEDVDPYFRDLYRALDDRLIEIDKEIADRPEGEQSVPPLKFGVSTLKPGQSDPMVPLLRAKLVKYLPKNSYPNANDIDSIDPYVYDEDLVTAVKAYQGDRGMQQDGFVGPATLEMLNRTIEDERKQILVNMHRLRQPEWQHRDALRIDVDVARYWLTAYEGGKVAFEMPVVVGSTARKTNIFTTIMTGVRLNPGWTLPPTIKSEDYIPKLRENPEWVTNQGVMIYPGWGKDVEPIDPTLIDWNYLSDNEIKAMRFYKQAGDNNPLGQYRFLMNNRYDIYLHDTNQKYLFNRTSRAKSSGCVRVFDPHKIAEFLLKDNPGWDTAKINSVLEKGETYDVASKRHIPVHFDYKTAWLDYAGELVLGHDVYGFDDGVYRDIIKIDSNYQQAEKN